MKGGVPGRLAAWLPAPRGTFVFLGLGSNLGDRLDHLEQAVRLLQDDAVSRVDAVSSVYQTAPVGGPADQPPYLNIALRMATRRSPRSLLRRCHAVEQALGRTREVRWGPRTIDVDVLLYGQRVIAARDLQVPHPRLRERAFALIPLVEVAPGMTFPDGTSLTAALAKLAPVEDVTAIGSQIRLAAGS